MTEKKTDKPVKETALVKKENEQLKGIDKSKAKQIKAVFEPMVKMLESFEEKYKEVNDLKTSPDKCKQAKRLRIDISRVRIDADKVRKIQKEEYIRAGNAIQGVYNILKFAVIDKEEKLKDIELHYERVEAEKKAQLQIDRAAELAKYEADGEFVDLGNMPDEVWKNYLAGVRNNYESVKEAERKAEENRVEAEKKQTAYDQRLKALLPFGDFFDSERLTLDSTEADFEQIIMDAKTGRTAHLAKQEKTRKENERLKKESDKKEKAKKIKEQKEKKEKNRMDKMFSLDLQFDGQSFIYKDINFHWTDLLCMTDVEFDKAFKGAKERKSVLDAEEAERLEAEKTETDRIAAEEKKALAAPDKEKLFSVATKLRNTKTTVKSPVAKKALEDAAVLIEKIAEAL